MLYIIGETIRQADDFARFKQIPRTEYRAISDVHSLKGLRNVTVILVGTFYKRRDWPEIEDFLRASRIATKRDESW